MRLLAIVALVSSALFALAACEGSRTEAASAPEDAADAADAAPAEAAVTSSSAVVDGGKGDAAPLAAGNFVTSVVDGPAWPESNVGTKRLGYLRNGAVVEAYERAIVNEDCTGGWHELVTGGYVCGNATTFDMSSPRVRLAPKQPDLDAGLPYRYGVSLADGTPLYRRVLAADDRKKYERPSASSAKASDDAKEPASKESAPADKDKDKDKEAEAESKDDAPVSTEDESQAHKPGDAGEARPEKPKLKDLKGRGVLVRKLARGFHLGLDRDFKAAGTRWWRTTFGFAVPFDRVMVTPSLTKHSGSWFLDGAPLLEADGGVVEALDAATPVSVAGLVGFVVHGAAHKLEVDEAEKKVGWGPELPKRSAVLFTGKEATISGVTYHQTTAGFWLRLADVKLARPAPPADLRPGEKWIDVDLTRQTLVAFEGLRPVFATLISSGRRNLQDKERDFPTPTGTFTIREKHVTATMDGDVASDGPYSIEDVPWVMYFHGSYALHGAYWHDSFGNVRSHGCVNMAPDDARTLFAWTDPPLPASWHGVFAQDDKQGTRVVVHEDPQPKRRR